MNKSTDKRGVIVGVFIIVGLLFLLAGIMMIGNLHETFVRKIKIVTLFEDVNGLQSGNNVWFSGVKIGTVSQLKFYGNSQVVVTMKIEKESQQYIRKNAMVKISTDGLIGNKIIVIYGGTFRSPQVEEGDTLIIEESFSSEDMMNTLQENNKNLLSITNDFKTISKKIANGEGNIGKILNNDSIYNNINAITLSLKKAADEAGKITKSLADFSSKLNGKGTLANDLVTDTIVFNSLKNSVIQLHQITDSAKVFVANINAAITNTKSPVGVLLYDEKSGEQLKSIIQNLDSSSQKLDEDLEAAQHSFLLRKYFKKEEKKQKEAEQKTK